eukprot:1161963-Pelagomonas_calceolata.AAC.1
MAPDWSSGPFLGDLRLGEWAPPGPPALKFGILAKQTMPDSAIVSGGRGRQWLPLARAIHPTPCHETWHAGQAKTLPPQVPGTAPVATNLKFKLHQHTFVDAHAGSGIWGCPFRIFNLCSINDVSCRVNREVKAQKFADAMRSMSCNP